MKQMQCDVVIIGMGIGAAALARKLATIGASLVMLPGAGRARFKHLDGGIVEPRILAHTLGDLSSVPVHRVGNYTVFRRDELETWAFGTLSGSVQVVDDFEEARVLPTDFSRLKLVDTSGDQSIIANSVVLTEGANPKLGTAAGIRKDFPPEDMIHFGRTFVAGASVQEPYTGSFRTSWNMPAWYSIIPQPDGVLVATSVRIENVMRAWRDGREVLKDFLAGDIAASHRIQGEQGEIGMELVPLKKESDHGRLGAHNIMISLDANGTIDARSLDRYNASLRSGAEMGAMMAQEWPNLVSWDVVGTNIWSMFGDPRTPYHDDSTTGFIEEGRGTRRGLFSRFRNR